VITQHFVTASINGVPLDPTEASVTFDEGWSPYIQASLTVPATTAAQISSLDPRQIRRVIVTLGENYGRLDTLADLTARYEGGRPGRVTAAFGGSVAALTGSLWHDFETPGRPYRPASGRVLNLHLRSRKLNFADNTVTLGLATDDALLQDSHNENVYAPTGGSFWYPEGLNVGQLVNWFLSRTGIPGAVVTDFGPEAATPVPAEHVLGGDEPTLSRWEIVSRVAQLYGMRLWCDEAQVWHLRADTPAVAGAPAVLTATTNVVDATDTLDRDDEWITGVVVEYTSPTTGARQLDIEYSGAQPIKLLVVKYAAEWPGKGAAARILKTRRLMGHVIPVTALSDYTVTPGRAVQITLPLTGVQAGVVSAVTHNFPADEMTLRTRELQETA
jgi:hypothetical protein